MRFLILMSLAVFMTTPAYAFRFLCRGPFVVTARPDGMIYGGPAIVFKRGSIGAAPNGQSLPKGTCAWADRGVATNEPNILRIRADIRESAPDMNLETVYALLRDEARRKFLLQSRMDYLTRSDYVVEFDALQAVGDTTRYLYVTESPFNNDAWIRLIPRPLP